MSKVRILDNRWLAPVLVAVFVLGLAVTAQAAPNLYRGSVVVEGFGNDTTDGTAYPYTIQVFLGVPFGQDCNANYGPYQSGCGGYEPNGQGGSPLTGAGTASTTGTTAARSFTIPAAAYPLGMRKELGTVATVFTTNTKGVKQPLRCFEQTTPVPGCGVQGGSFSYYFPYIYSFTYADMENKAGNFFKGGGPGNFNLPYSVAAVKVADVTVKKGANQFGGTMRLLGFFHTQFGYQASAGLDVGTADWLFEYVGAGSNKNTAGTVTKAYTYNGVLPSATNKYQNTAVTGTVTSTVAVEAFGWTTGTATVTAKGRGPFPTVQKRKGVDNRTASGKGTIQLVSPMLTHWVGPIEQLDTGGIGFLKLEFVPEPEKGMMLVAGVSLLGLLYRYRA